MILGGKPFSCCVMPLGQIPWGYDFVVVARFSLQMEDQKDAFGGNLWLRDVSWMSKLIPVFGNEVHRRSRNLQRYDVLSLMYLCVNYKRYL